MNSAVTTAGKPLPSRARRGSIRIGIRSSIVLWLLLFMASSLALFFQIKVYEPWGQVTDLWGDTEDVLDLTDHFHFYRFLVAYPGLALEELIQGKGFSLYITAFVATNAVIFRKTVMQARFRPPPAWAWLLFLAAHFFMNGRGAIGWTGWLLCVYICVASDTRLNANTMPSLRKLFLIPVSLLLSSVTSGIFIAAALSFSYIFFIRKLKDILYVKIKLSLKKIILLGVAPLIVWLAGGYLIAGIAKVMEFYGGGSAGLMDMARHGFGRLAGDPLMLAALLVMGSVFVFVSWLYAFRHKRNRSLLVLAAIPAGGGLVWYTILTLVIPVWLVSMTPQGRGKQ